MKRLTPKGRARVAVLASTALIGSFAATITAAQAGTAPPFTIDGAVADAGAQLFPDEFGNAQELGPLNSNATKLGAIHNAAPPMLGTTNPNGQVDLRNIWLDTAKDGDDDSWLYFAWERDSNRGSGVIMYEFMQDSEPVACDYSLTDAELISGCNPWANRQAGDFILVWDQVGNTINIILRYWEEDADGNLVLGAGQNLTEQDPQYAYAALSADNFKGEAAVNLSQTIFAGRAECLTIGNVIPGTVTGNSDTADYKDTVLADVSEFVNISNCGSVRVTKVTDPADGTGSFGYDLYRSGGGDIRYEADGYTGAELTNAEGTLTEDGDSELVVDLIAGADYTLDEGDLGDQPYELTSIVCTPEGGTPATDGVNVYPGDSDFTVSEGETTDCVITNTKQPGTLVVEKVVVNDDGGSKTASQFSFQVDAGTATAFTEDPENELLGSNQVTLDEGTYDVTEAGLPIAGYATTYEVDGAAADDCLDLELPAGGTVTCTITNDDIPGKLVVEKVVVNDNGGGKTASDFSFEVDGANPTAFIEDPQNGLLGSNELTVDAGTYDVTEVGVPVEGYTTTYEVDGVAADDCTDLDVGLDQTVTCTITNDDTPAAPSGTTVQSWTLHDELTLTGVRVSAPDAGSAKVTFRVYSDDQCTVEVGSEEDTTIGSGTATTTNGVAVTDSGTYYWTAEYSGDQFNEGFTTDCGEEVTQILAKDFGRDDFASSP